MLSSPLPQAAHCDHRVPEQNGRSWTFWDWREAVFQSEHGIRPLHCGCRVSESNKKHCLFHNFFTIHKLTIYWYNTINYIQHKLSTILNACLGQDQNEKYFHIWSTFPLIPPIKNVCLCQNLYNIFWRQQFKPRKYTVVTIKKKCYKSLISKMFVSFLLNALTKFDYKFFFFFLFKC